MKSVILSSVLILGILGQGPLLGVEAPKVVYLADDWLKTIQLRYRELQAVSASFSQELSNPRLPKPTPQTGRATFKIPGKMKWQYEGENRKEVGSDGQLSWIYDVQDHQVVVTSQAAKHDFLGLLWGQGDLVKHFKLESSSSQGRPGVVQLLLKPRLPAAGIDKVMLHYDQKIGIVSEVRIFDLLGGQNRIRFNKIEINPKLPDDWFALKVPKGVQRVDL